MNPGPIGTGQSRNEHDLARAVELHKAGQLIDAARIYHDVLGRDPNHA
jgi:hypothetical protein